ncbi:MAG: HlyC/CorC family transporter [Lachnospiraceae bacterium]|nr:HlyC/CorC family transporter [Lachnospiraceae bacterium]
MDPYNAIMLGIIILLVLLSSFFSSAETALTTVTRMKVRMMLDDKRKGAVILDKVKNQSGKMLSTILIGNNIVNIAASSLTTVFAQRMYGNSAISIATGILTFVVLMFGEIVPKTAASIHADAFALVYAVPIYALMTILTPIIFIIDKLTFVLLKIFRISTDGHKSITEDELRTIIDVSQEEGIIESGEVNMINNLFDFGDTCAKDIMIPKVDIAMISVDATYDELIEIVKTDKYTRIPVYRDDTDNIVGIINIKDMLIKGVTRNTFNAEELMYEPFYTIATKDLNDLLVEMRDDNTSLCIVVDEYGNLDGLITLEDIIEEIVGEIRDEFDEDEENDIIQLGENEYLVEGQINLDDMNDEFGTDIDSEHYESVGGIIMEQLDRLPEVGDKVTVKNVTFEVMRMDNMRIEKVKITIEPDTDEDGENTENE